MNVEILCTFFMWCTIIHAALLIYTAACIWLAPDFIYRVQYRLFPIPREQFNLVIYSYLALFKIFFITFNLVPWLALLIIKSA